MFARAIPSAKNLPILVTRSTKVRITARLFARIPLIGHSTV
jgi:hypothetical protein